MTDWLAMLQNEQFSNTMLAKSDRLIIARSKLQVFKAIAVTSCHISRLEEFLPLLVIFQELFKIIFTKYKYLSHVLRELGNPIYVTN